MTQTERKTILITGAAGFIGSQFSLACQSRKWLTIAVDHLEHFRARPEIRPEVLKIEHFQMVDRARLPQWLEQNSTMPIHAIVHLGACTDTTQMDVGYLNKMNLEYSQWIWKWATEKKIPLVYASSAATYGAGEKGYSDDETALAKLRPLNPYGDSKHQFDLWVQEEIKKKCRPPTWAGFKFFNVYGFGERHKGKMASVVLQAFDQIQNTGKVRLFKSHKQGIADGHQKRDFIYVDDVVRVLMFALDAPALTNPIDHGIYNLGTGQARTFLDLVRAVFDALKIPENIEFIDTPVTLQNQYQYFTEAPMAKLRQAGYDRHFTALEDGVEKVIRQLKNHETSVAAQS